MEVEDESQGLEQDLIARMLSPSTADANMRKRKRSDEDESTDQIQDFRRVRLICKSRKIHEILDDFPSFGQINVDAPPLDLVLETPVIHDSQGSNSGPLAEIPSVRSETSPLPDPIIFEDALSDKFAGPRQQASPLHDHKVPNWSVSDYDYPDHTDLAPAPLPPANSISWHNSAVHRTLLAENSFRTSNAFDDWAKARFSENVPLIPADLNSAQPPLQDYQMRLMLYEQQKKTRRLLELQDYQTQQMRLEQQNMTRLRAIAGLTEPRGESSHVDFQTT
jgi:hypothetical protein